MLARAKKCFLLPLQPSSNFKLDLIYKLPGYENKLVKEDKK
jgi:hypothetical protein